MDTNFKNDARFQGNQEVSDASETKADTGDNSYVVTETKRSGGKLKQEVAAQVVAQGKGTSGVDTLASPGAYGKIAGSYTGDGKAVLGNFANTPKLVGDHQGSSREDKKLSDPNKDINLMASEQYATYFEQPKALAVDREATVGYNGNPSNISARSQKNSGFTPAELTYDRSVDEIRKDQMIFITGQVVSDNSANGTSRGYPTSTWWDSENNKPVVGTQSKATNLVRSNYMPHSVEVTIKRTDAGTYVSKFAVNESNLDCQVTNPDVINESSACHVIDTNRAEITRQAIDNDHGSPTSPKYNPLGRSVAEPSATMLYLMDMEQVTGSMVMSSVRHALKQRAYYLTRVGKDGISQKAPVVDAMYGHLIGWNSTKAQMSEGGYQFTASGSNCPYENTSYNGFGSAMTLIHCFDSMAKYKTKADVVNQPRGLKLPLQTGLSNHTPFHVSEDFIKALNAIDTFSTIDRSYDPSAPTCISDGLAYVLPYSWKNALAYTRDSINGPRKYTSKLFAYRYQAGQGTQTYYIKVADPVLNGVAWFLEQYASSIYEAIGNGSKDKGERTLSIPVRSYTTHFSLWDYLVCASSAYILYERTNSMKDILDEEQHSGYPFKHMVSVSKESISSPINYGTLSMFDRINVKEMRPAAAMRWIMPELFFPIGNEVLCPWYFSESDFEAGSDNTHARMKDTVSHFPAPVIRSGVAISYLDDFYGMTLKDQLLSIDRLTLIPGYGRMANIPMSFYKYGRDSAGIPVAPLHDTNVSILLSTPRQIGWTADVPEGVCKAPQWYSADDDKRKIAYFSRETILTDITMTHPSFMARVYSGGSYGDSTNYGGSKPSDILSSEVVSIGRGQAFSQVWDNYYASHKSLDGGSDILLSNANAFSRRDNDIMAVANRNTFTPYTNKDGSIRNPRSNTPVYSSMRALWARVQKLPFVLNPFDAGDPDDVGIVDPFDFAYIFGLAGFMDVTYFEELSNRMSDKYAKMFNFVEDPFFTDSPLYN